MTFKYNDVEIDKITGNTYKNHLLVNYKNERLNFRLTGLHYLTTESQKVINSIQQKKAEDIYKFH